MSWKQKFILTTVLLTLLKNTLDQALCKVWNIRVVSNCKQLTRLYISKLSKIFLLKKSFIAKETYPPPPKKIWQPYT